jgi:iron only hydrogenase large subunit-like protein
MPVASIIRTAIGFSKVFVWDDGDGAIAEKITDMVASEKAKDGDHFITSYCPGWLNGSGKA